MPTSMFLLAANAAQAGANGGERLRALRRDVADARRAVTEGRGDDARAAFLRALTSLASPLDPGPVASPPLFAMIDRGEALYREALFGAAALATAADAPLLLQRLDELLREPARFGSTLSLDFLQAKLLKAFVIMQANAGNAIQRQERYEAAEKIVRSVVDHTDFQAIAPELLLPANALDLELAARRYERAARQGDVKARRKLLPRLLDRATILLANQADASKRQREIAADYEAEVIGFLARMQLWNVAVERARRFTTNPAYAETAGARAVLADPLLAPFVDEGRVLSPEEIRSRAPLFKAAFAKIRAALAEAGAANLKESATVGALGALTWLAADAVADGAISSVLAPAIVAAGASVFNRIRNGWGSDEALSAGMTGVYDRTMEQSAKDVAKLLVQGGLETAVWTAPASLIAVAPEAIPLAGQTLASAADLYARFFSWAGNGALALADPATYAQAANSLSSLSSGDVWQAAYKTYLGLTAAQYVSFLLFPKARPALAKSAKYFIPGAVMLGAELGMAITGKADYGDRIERSTIAVAEGLSMLLASGVVALAKSHSVGSAFKSLGEGIRKMDHNSLVAIALTVGVSSAMGGMMQRGSRPEEVALLAVQGAATTVGLLGVVLGISGIMKREIEFFDGMKEGWDDSRGEMIAARIGQALLGGADSFWTPYVFNRVGRAPTLDVPSAGIRSMIGWDTNLGYGLFALINLIATNPTATTVYPETGAKEWERDALKQMLNRNEADRVRDHFLKAGQRMPLTHPLRPHNLADALFPLFAIKRIFKPPVFPLMPQTHYFGSLQQLIDGGYWNALTADEFESMLGVVERLAQEAFVSGGTPDEQAKRQGYQDILRSIVQVLAVTRDSELRGERVRRFFDDHAWLTDLLAIDDATPSRALGRYRRERRHFVNGQVAMPMERYDEHVREHAVRMKPSALEGSFTKKRFTGVTDAPPSGSNEDEKRTPVAGAGEGAEAALDASAVEATTTSPAVVVPPTTVLPR